MIRTRSSLALSRLPFILYFFVGLCLADWFDFIRIILVIEWIAAETSQDHSAVWIFTEMLISKQSPRRKKKRSELIECFYIYSPSSTLELFLSFPLLLLLRLHRVFVPLHFFLVARSLPFLVNNNNMVQFSFLFCPNGVIVGAQADAKYISAFELCEPNGQIRRAMRTPRDVVCGRARQLQVSACERDCVEWLHRTSASMGAIVFVRPLNTWRIDDQD